MENVMRLFDELKLSEGERGFHYAAMAVVATHVKAKWDASEDNQRKIKEYVGEELDKAEFIPSVMNLTSIGFMDYANRGTWILAYLQHAFLEAQTEIDDFSETDIVIVSAYRAVVLELLQEGQVRGSKVMTRLREMADDDIDEAQLMGLEAVAQSEYELINHPLYEILDATGIFGAT